MGYLLKEALKTLCGVNQWSYAVFWKIACQNPKLLIWEECYYGPITYSGLPHIDGIERSEFTIEDWEACWVSGVHNSQHGGQAGDRVHSLLNKMKDNHVHVVGQGLVGRAALAGNHQWILSETCTIETHPPEVLNEVYQQFSAGMQTLAVIPVFPHGVVQLGSSSAIMEDMGFVNDVKTLMHQLGYVCGALLPDDYATRESSLKAGVPSSHENSVPTGLCGIPNVTNSAPFISDSCSQQSSSSLASRLVGQTSYDMAQISVKSSDDQCRAKAFSLMKPKRQYRSPLVNGVTGSEVIPLNPVASLNQEASLYIPRLGYDPQPSGGQSPANDGHLRLMEQPILSDAVVQDPSNDTVCASNDFLMSQQRTNGGLASSSHKGFTAGLQSTSCVHVAGSGRQSTDSSRTKASTPEFADHLTTDYMFSGSRDDKHNSVDEKCTPIELAEGKERVENDLFQSLSIPMMPRDEHLGSSEHSYEHQSLGKTDGEYENSCVRPSSGDDLFDILGMDVKSKLFNGSWNDFTNNGPCTKAKNFDKNNCGSESLQGVGSDMFSINEGNQESGIFSVTGSDSLLDAVVSRAHSAVKQTLEDNVSCRSTLTKISSSSSCITSPSSVQANVSNRMRGELLRLPKSLTKEGALGSCAIRPGLCKEVAGNNSQTNSSYGSQISSWVEQGQDMKRCSSVSTKYSKRPEEIGKSNRKRLKPGENPRPRPKDRQMIQDRVKELRGIVPNGAKCSIDALLERAIKHMLFLQSVTKHADKLNQTGESKLRSTDGGFLLKDNSQGGATWAYEVGSQSMICPIIVEDLNTPRQFLVEMLCEDRGLFLEIADIVRGLGLTIVNGVMETRSGKIWARFAVEANRDVTRMEIFISLVRLLEQTIKTGAAPANCSNNDNMTVRQSLHQATSIPATGMPRSFQ